TLRALRYISIPPFFCVWAICSSTGMLASSPFTVGVPLIVTIRRYAAYALKAFSQFLASCGEYIRTLATAGKSLALNALAYSWTDASMAGRSTSEGDAAAAAGAAGAGAAAAGAGGGAAAVASGLGCGAVTGGPDGL